MPGLRGGVVAVVRDGGKVMREGGKLVVGVDPGLRGGWAALRVDAGGRHGLVASGDVVLDESRRRVDVVGMAAVWGDLLRAQAAGARGAILALEEVGARPGQGVAGMFAFGRAAGALEGVLAGLGVQQVRRLSPGRWKASLGLPGGKAGKGASIALARRLLRMEYMPEHQAEAALMAWIVAVQLARGE